MSRAGLASTSFVGDAADVLGAVRRRLASFIVRCCLGVVWCVRAQARAPHSAASWKGCWARVAI